MRVLFLTQILPYPPDAGPRIKTWHVLRYLADRGDTVTLVTFLRPEERQFLPHLESLCERVIAVPIRRSRFADIRYWLRSLISGRPFLIERDDLPAMRDAVNGVLASGEIDVIHADQLTMTQFALPEGAFSRGKHGVRADRRARPRLVFDAHNATWTILDRLARTSAIFLRPVLAVERDRLRRYEGHLVRSFHTTMAVSTVDRSALLAAANAVDSQDYRDRLRVIPIAIDTRQEQVLDRKRGSRTIVAVGSLHYPPNAGGIRWFIQSVFPIIRQRSPEARLVVIGKSPPDDFLRAAQESQGAIEVIGYVPDLEPYLRDCALMVVPVLAGGGMRVRILEAFARGIPMVTTTIGLEGIDAEPGRDILVADEPESFASAVVEVLQNPTLQQRLTDCGRSLVAQRYDWQVALRQLDDVYAAAQHETIEG